jgi:nucleoside-diphosphate-sugar epimerase
MYVFVSGGTGYIGSEVVKALAQAGHEVTALVRSPEKAARIKSLGARPHVGDYKNLASFKAAALASDAVIHTAMEYSPEGIQKNSENLLEIIKAAKSGGPKIVVFTTGVWVLGNAEGDESASTDHPAQAVAWRVPQEKAVLAAASEGVGVAVVRPGIVYGGKRGTIGGWFTAAQKEGAVSYAGAGDNHWSFVHNSDLAQLYALIAEKRGRGIYHGVDGKPVRLADAARAVQKAAGKSGEPKSIPAAEALKGMGPLAEAFMLDQKISATRSVELGWGPKHPDFVSDAPKAFSEWRAG